MDYLLLGSDGIFDRLENEQIHKYVMDKAAEGYVRARQIMKQPQHSMAASGHAPPPTNSSTEQNLNFMTLTASIGSAVDDLMHQAMLSESMDNLSVVIIAF